MIRRTLADFCYVVLTADEALACLAAGGRLPAREIAALRQQVTRPMVRDADFEGERSDGENRVR
jgi:hypothetical protein